MRRPASPLRELADITRTTLDDLSAGKDWEDAVVRCYAQMNTVVGIRPGLRRQQAMTTSEFAVRLEQAGLPGEPVRRLTRLFEAVRYGSRKSRPEEAHEAVNYLTAILHYCEEAR